MGSPPEEESVTCSSVNGSNGLVWLAHTLIDQIIQALEPYIPIEMEPVVQSFATWRQDSGLEILDLLRAMDGFPVVSNDLDRIVVGITLYLLIAAG